MKQCVRWLALLDQVCGGLEWLVGLGGWMSGQGEYQAEHTLDPLYLCCRAAIAQGHRWGPHQ